MSCPSTTFDRILGIRASETGKLALTAHASRQHQTCKINLTIIARPGSNRVEASFLPQCRHPGGFSDVQKWSKVVLHAGLFPYFRYTEAYFKAPPKPP
jgi:hypothetical protein